MKNISTPLCSTSRNTGETDIHQGLTTIGSILQGLSIDLYQLLQPLQRISGDKHLSNDQEEIIVLARKKHNLVLHDIGGREAFHQL